MKLKLDENLGRAAARLFENAGHDVETVRGEGLAGAPDRDVIAACQREQRCLVTLDFGFGNPLVFPPADYAGIAVLRLPSKPALQDLSLACRTLIRALEGAAITGRLWSVERARIREYRPEGLTETDES